MAQLRAAAISAARFPSRGAPTVLRPMTAAGAPPARVCPCVKRCPSALRLSARRNRGRVRKMHAQRSLSESIPYRDPRHRHLHAGTPHTHRGRLSEDAQRHRERPLRAALSQVEHERLTLRERLRPLAQSSRIRLRVIPCMRSRPHVRRRRQPANQCAIPNLGHARSLARA